MMQDTNKTAIITASSKGLGFSIAKYFSSQGYGVILHGRDEEKLNHASKCISNVVDIVKGDLRDKATIDKIFESSVKNNVNLLINNAAIPCSGLGLQEMDTSQIEDNLFTNLLSPVFLTHRLYGIIKENGPGGIITLNSIVGIEPKKNRSVHSASKWGLKGFFKSLRIEAEIDKIKVMNVYPTRIMTHDSYEYGLDPDHVSKIIYEEFHKEKTDLDLVIDGRPEEFRPGNFS